MSPNLNRDDLDIQNALRAYAPPVPDNGFTAATLARAEKSKSLRLSILGTAGFIGGALALSQMPSLWKLINQFSLPINPADIHITSPYTIMAIGVLGFVVWAVLDRGWSDTV